MSGTTSTGLHVAGLTLRKAMMRLQGQHAEVQSLEATPFLSGDESSASSPDHSARGRHGECVASLPSADVMTRIWAMPPADTERLKQMVSHRLSADLPVAFDEMAWDARRGIIDDCHDGASLVIAQAARSERVAAHVAALGRLGHAIETLTTEAEALAALCRHGLGLLPSSQTEAILLAGEESWLVFIYSDGVVRSLRRIKMTAISVEAACHQSREFLQNEKSNPLPHRLLICAPDDVEGLRDRLVDRLEMAVEPIEASCLEQHLRKDGGSVLTCTELVEYAVSIGLALIGLHRPETMICLGGHLRDEAEHQARQRIEAWLSHPWRWSAVAALVLILAAGAYLNALHGETGRIKALQEGINPETEAMTALQPKATAAQRIERYRLDVEAIMAEVCEEIPESMVLSSIKLSRRGGLEIKTTKGDSKAGFKLAEALRKRDLFSNVQATVAIGKEGFTVTADIEGIEPLTGQKGKGATWR